MKKKSYKLLERDQVSNYLKRKENQKGIIFLIDSIRIPKEKKYYLEIFERRKLRSKKCMSGQNITYREVKEPSHWQTPPPPPTSLILPVPEQVINFEYLAVMALVWCLDRDTFKEKKQQAQQWQGQTTKEVKEEHLQT